MMNKQYIPKRKYLETLENISKFQEEIKNRTQLLDEAYYGFGPSPSFVWCYRVESCLSIYKYCLKEEEILRGRYESEQYKHETIEECRSKKPLGWHDLDPDDIDFDDIDSPNFFDVQFANPWE
jgi:hypothetical protein